MKVLSVTTPDNFSLQSILQICIPLTLVLLFSHSLDTFFLTESQIFRFYLVPLYIKSNKFGNDITNGKSLFLD